MSGITNDPIVRHAYGLDRRWDINADRTPAVLRTNRQPMREPATARWDLDISAADFAELKLGFKPRQMEDKWAIAAAEPDGDGVTCVYVMRSWTRAECYILHVKSTGTDGTAAARIESITWEQKLNESATTQHTERRAKMLAAYLCRTHVGCALEKLPIYNTATIRGSDGDDGLTASNQILGSDVDFQLGS
ncbi:hypothetical protein MCOR25_010881 [Pyricularia grisea]|uniref:Uncharacterized protein n=1 Tax=Pyricularia grisea TaxID=148305 RepID=A0A6P8AUP0_PYRGI|nr:uncharacterized protein PgNI_08518 [Pyricularia grisea]KAI6347835.1 hypothetical protein MCOR25_010881 [Pyricularia grisea]TLD05874.1 hypothetical protein PgNI_08518 [Pyricularia grisea]